MPNLINIAGASSWIFFFCPEKKRGRSAACRRLQPFFRKSLYCSTTRTVQEYQNYDVYRCTRLLDLPLRDQNILVRPSIARIKSRILQLARGCMQCKKVELSTVHRHIAQAGTRAGTTYESMKRSLCPSWLRTHASCQTGPNLPTSATRPTFYRMSKPPFLVGRARARLCTTDGYVAGDAAVTRPGPYAVTRCGPYVDGDVSSWMNLLLLLPAY
jgi:hypothetical protein